MDITVFAEQFHFLRPMWLLMVIPAVLLTWSVYRRSDSLRGWRKVVSLHLLEHMVLTQSGEQGRWRPVYLMGLSWLFACLALAGPSWQTQDSPFSEDRAGMFIIVKVTPEMLAMDIQPTRLQRGVIKIQDLLEIRKDTRTGLIAYAGSAHLVMPLTSDAGIINDFAAALEPAIMPRQGDEPAEAIALANRRLQQAGSPGSIVLITDHIDRSQLRTLEAMYQQGGTEVHILAVAAGTEVIPPPGSPPAPPLDMDSLTRAAHTMGGSVTAVTADKRDVERLASRIERSISHAPNQQGKQWRDDGYYLLWALLLTMLLFFRRGGSVAFE